MRTVTAFVAALVLVVSGALSTKAVDGELNKTFENITDSDLLLKSNPSLRQIKNNPEKFVNHTVTVSGVSNSLRDFVKDDGYMMDMECDYPGFTYSRPFKAEMKVLNESNGVSLKCVKRPKSIGYN